MLVYPLRMEPPLQELDRGTSWGRMWFQVGKSEFPSVALAQPTPPGINSQFPHGKGGQVLEGAAQGGLNAHPGGVRGSGNVHSVLWDWAQRGLDGLEELFQPQRFWDSVGTS